MKRLIALLGVVYFITLCLPPAFAWDRDYRNALMSECQEGSDRPTGEDHPWGENDQVAAGDSGRTPSGWKTWYETGLFYFRAFWLGWDHPKVVNEIKQTEGVTDDTDRLSDPEQTHENENDNSTKPGNS